MIDFFHTILYQPLFNALILIYQYFPGRDFGVAVIVLTLLIKFLLYPLAAKGIKNQKKITEIQPKVKALQEKFKNDKEKQVKEVMDLYKKEQVNPFSGFLPILIQLPVLITLFWLFKQGLEAEQLKNLYGFIPHPGQLDPSFLGLINLSEKSAMLAFITGIAQFFQAKTSGQPKNDKKPADFSQMMQKQMLYFFPIFTVFILWQLPSAIALYWLTTTLFTIGQQYIILKKSDNSKYAGRAQEN